MVRAFSSWLGPNSPLSSSAPDQVGGRLQRTIQYSTSVQYGNSGDYSLPAFAGMTIDKSAQINWNTRYRAHSASDKIRSVAGDDALAAGGLVAGAELARLL